MTKVAFIGSYDKADMIIYLAKALTIAGKKVIVVDSTVLQKTRYIVPTIQPLKKYITTYEGELYQQEYDYIILLDVLEHLTYPLECLKKWKKCLKKDGIFIINIPNLMHYTVMYNLLKLGRFPYADIGLLDCTHCHLFTYQ